MSKEFKPLTPERIAEIEEIFRNVPEFAEDVQQAYRDLLTERAFWRDAVRNSEPLISHCDRQDRVQCMECIYCAGTAGPGEPQHKPDCAWLLAQEI